MKFVEKAKTHISYSITFFPDKKSYPTYCSGKATRIIYSECVSVALVIQHSKGTHCVILSSVAWLALPYFSTATRVTRASLNTGTLTFASLFRTRPHKIKFYVYLACWSQILDKHLRITNPAYLWSSFVSIYTNFIWGCANIFRVRKESVGKWNLEILL